MKIFKAIVSFLGRNSKIDMNFDVIPGFFEDSRAARELKRKK